MDSLPVKFGPDGLVPAVVQELETGAVVMLAYMNEDALHLTRETGRTHFWSRSRQRIWRKGETSGNEQIVHDILVNCYQDSLLVRVTQIGPGCHTDHASCFFRQLDDDGLRSVAVTMADARTWLGAYEFLGEQDLSDVSSTSRLLRSQKPQIEDRLADELVELAGVLRGTHRHGDRTEDLLLEASQCFYWLALIAVRAHLSAEAWLTPLTHSRRAVDVEAAIARLILGAEFWGELVAEHELDEAAVLIAGTAISIAAAVRAAGGDLESVFARDLLELRSKRHLAPYFASRV